MLTNLNNKIHRAYDLIDNELLRFSILMLVLVFTVSFPVIFIDNVFGLLFSMTSTLVLGVSRMIYLLGKRYPDEV